MGCSAKKRIEEPTDSLTFATKNFEKDMTPYNSLSADDNDCVFNNDFKGLTTEWLSKLKITDFVWREDIHGALIPKGVDTTFISQGGCTHFGTTVELWARTEVREISDSIFWISKALELADNYQLTDYADIIRKGNFRKLNHDDDSVTYEVYPDEEIDNAIYEGINIVSEKEYVRLSISKYLN